jgi:hypothetical protein
MTRIRLLRSITVVTVSRRVHTHYGKKPEAFLRRTNPMPKSDVPSKARLPGSGTALDVGVTERECRSTSAPLVVALSAAKKR